MPAFRIGNRMIGAGHPAFVVAELGQNHQGDAYLAMRMAAKARQAGADAVKFAKRSIGDCLTREALDRPYSGSHSFGNTYREHREALELSIGNLLLLKERIRNFNGWNLEILSSVTDLKSLEDLQRIGFASAYKIPSSHLESLPLIEAAARTGLPVILSTGMLVGLEGIGEALEVIYRYHRRVIVLHCLSKYPIRSDELELVDMPRMLHIGERFGCLVGYSDHTDGLDACVVAATLRAVMIEKHFTMSRSMPGRDHAASCEPGGLQTMIGRIRRAEDLMRACPANVRSNAAKDARQKLAQGLVTQRLIPRGDIIRPEDLTLKAPAGIGWADRALVMGRRATSTIPPDTTLRWEHIGHPLLELERSK